jgi:hypothetical protein
MFQKLIDILGDIEVVKYQTTYLPVAEALSEQGKARKVKDEEAEMYWGLRTVGASGNATVPGSLDNYRFDFKPESVRETFERVFGPKNRISEI